MLFTDESMKIMFSSVNVWNDITGATATAYTVARMKMILLFSFVIYIKKP